MSAITEYRNDAAGNKSTRYTLEPKDTVQGELSGPGDKDWFRIDLSGGITYEFALTGLKDGYITLRDASGEVVHRGTEEIHGQRLTINVADGGNYYLEIGTTGTGNGSYTLDIDRDLPAGDYEDLAEYLEQGYWEWDEVKGVIFDTRQSRTLTVNMEALAEPAQLLARQRSSAA